MDLQTWEDFRLREKLISFVLTWSHLLPFLLISSNALEKGKTSAMGSPLHLRAGVRLPVYLAVTSFGQQDFWKGDSEPLWLIVPLLTLRPRQPQMLLLIGERHERSEGPQGIRMLSKYNHDGAMKRSQGHIPGHTCRFYFALPIGGSFNSCSFLDSQS